MPGGLRHAAHARRQVDHALALEDGELAEQEEGLARLGGDPVRVAAAGVQVRDWPRPARAFAPALARKSLISNGPSFSYC